MGKAFLSAFFCVFHCVPKVFLLLEVSSANISINGTRGDPLLWSCHYIFSEPFQPEQSLIFWQGYKKMDIVLHIYRKGQQEFHYQSQSFQNRTTVFPDQLPSGNFSLVIEPLMLQDNQIFIEVIFLSENKPTKKLCQTTVYVAAPFQEPKIEMNQKEKTATCSTKGGFPEPVIRWMSGNGGTKVGLSEATMISEEDNGTFSVSSTVIITGLKKVICEIYNPTLNQTLIATEDVPTPKNPVLTAIIIISVIFYIVILPGLIIYQYIKQQRRGNKSDREHEFVDPPKDKERQRPGNECDRHQLYEHPLEKGNQPHQFSQPRESPSTAAANSAKREAAVAASNLPEENESGVTVSLRDKVDKCTNGKKNEVAVPPLTKQLQIMMWKRRQKSLAV